MSNLTTVTGNVSGLFEHEGNVVIDGDILTGSTVIIRNGCLLVRGETGDHVTIRQSSNHNAPQTDLSRPDWWLTLRDAPPPHGNDKKLATRMTRKNVPASLSLCGVRLNKRAGAGLVLESANDVVLAQAGPDARLAVGGNLVAGGLGERGEINASCNLWIHLLGPDSHVYSGSEMCIDDAGERCSLESALTINGAKVRDGVSGSAGGGIRFQALGDGVKFTANDDIVCDDTGADCVFSTIGDIKLRHVGERCHLTGESLKATSLGDYSVADMENDARILQAVGEHAHVRADRIFIGSLLPHAIATANGKAVFGDIHKEAIVNAGSIEAKRILGGNLRAWCGRISARLIAPEAMLNAQDGVFAGHAAQLAVEAGKVLEGLGGR
jgi:hypothetical protein